MRARRETCAPRGGDRRLDETLSRGAPDDHDPADRYPPGDPRRDAWVRRRVADIVARNPRPGRDRLRGGGIVAAAQQSDRSAWVPDGTRRLRYAHRIRGATRK